MTHPARRAVAAVAAAAAVAAGMALAGCAQSSNSTSSATSGPGAAPPTATTPTSTATGTATTPGSTPPASAHGLSVTPTVGTTHSVMHFVITPSPTTAGQNTNDISNALSVIGPQKPGCVGVHEQGLAALPADQQTTVSLGPAQLGGNWCPGTYSARVATLERPKCGQGQMCPQFIRVLAVIGPVSFKISG